MNSTDRGRSNVDELLTITANRHTVTFNILRFDAKKKVIAITCHFFQFRMTIHYIFPGNVLAVLSKILKMPGFCLRFPLDVLFTLHVYLHCFDVFCRSHLFACRGWSIIYNACTVTTVL